MEQKRYAKIGTAVIDKDRCIAWEQDRQCLVCDECCPYDAIHFQEGGDSRLPVVDELKCNGCGACEHACPIDGEAAIVVTPMGAIHLDEGSYREEAEERGLKFEKIEYY